MVQEFTKRVIDVIKNIPKGKVTTYGSIATMAGNPRGARQVTRILHSMTRKYQLPWHRVVNSRGKISIPNPSGAEYQRSLLKDEGVNVSDKFQINLNKYQWIRIEI